jgi:gamma-glutamyltranspeptidase / glutathione hydrolase
MKRIACFLWCWIMRAAAGSSGMVVCSHPLAGEAGVAVLRAGGNAVDAAVATGMALAVVHPSAGNIGGGGFMVVRMKDGRTAAFDFREKAPAAAHAGLFLDATGRLVPGSNHNGHRAVGVPGTVAGFDLALKKLGTKDWHALTAEAVRLAAEGFALSPAMAREFNGLANDWRRNPAAARIFLKPDGQPWQAGDRWVQPDLALCLGRIAREGRDGFYKGETARLIAEDMKAHGGLITEADLAAYDAKERAVLRAPWRGFEVLSMPPPSSGGTALAEMLNMLEHDNLRALGHNSAAYLHLCAEVMRRAFADRAEHMGDPDFNPALPLVRLLSKEHAAALRRGIAEDKASVSESAKFNTAYESEETTHYSVVDREGNVVAVTYTLEYSYGARLVCGGAGFLYNNEMGDFNPQPGRTDASGLIGTPPNVIAPGKRMLSSMTPVIVCRDGTPVLVLGSPGGRTIINTVLQTVLNVLAFDLPLKEAVAAPRIHHQWLPDEVRVERGIPTGVRRALEAKGHTVREGGTQGRMMAIAIDARTGERTGVADPRDPDGAVAVE